MARVRGQTAFLAFYEHSVGLPAVRLPFRGGRHISLLVSPQSTMHWIKLFPKEQQIESEFHVSIYIVVYKFLLGLFEFGSGLAIAFFGSRLYQFYEASLLKELSEDPHDVLARLSESVVPSVLTHNNYVVIYLLALGLAKMIGAIGLIYKQNWGVDLLVVLTVLMAPFQIVSLILHPQIFDLLYLVVGLLIALYLIEFKPRAWVSRLLLKFNG